MGEPEEQPRHEVEQAITCFERLHGVLVTVHDYEGRLRGFVGQQRLVHRHQLCLAAKGPTNASVSPTIPSECMVYCPIAMVALFVVVMLGSPRPSLPVASKAM